MMRINRRTDYAIRVLLALAKNPFGNRISTQQIQETMLIPKAFLLRIIADLSRARLIQTFPGPKGGIQLSRDPESISLKMVWEALEGPLVISDCVKSPEDCPLNPHCPVNSRWSRIQKNAIHELETTYLSTLAFEAKQMGA